MRRSKRFAAEGETEKAQPPEKEHAPDAAEPSVAKKHVFPIVGVGASAGGLEAFTAFLKPMPAESGMAFVLIQHLDPKQHSQLTDLLSKASRMPVQEVRTDTTVKANHVYVISPGVCLSLSGGRLRVEPREPGRNLPIDHFFRSLASDAGSTAIGIVLSGTASDGTLGLKSIKVEGGITFAQEPSSAKFDGMPRSAIAAGVADFVMPPTEIAKRLVRLAQHPYVARKPEQADDAAQETEFELNRVFRLLRSATGNDFAHYKAPTIRRRIHRRMVLHGSEKVSEYSTYLHENPAEVRALADDLLICVTSFFREHKAYETLEHRVFPEILKNRSSDNPIRVWVPGCATGEEAYSIAICLAEYLERRKANVPIQIFATDVSETGLEKARTGIYDTAGLGDVSAARLKRFFTKANGGYQIRKMIREMCVFAKQNLIKDPPFHNLDLISCCNVLIYFGPVLQTKALSIFHYALKPEGLLLLGPSEGVGALPHAFVPVEKKIRLYSKQPGSYPLNVPFLASGPSWTSTNGSESTGENARAAPNVQRTAERMLLSQYAPAGVIVDDAMTVVHVRGDTGPYLQLAPGEPTYNLLRMAREGLVVSLRKMIERAKRSKGTIALPIRVKQNGQFKEVHLKVIPIKGPVRAKARHFMVLFEEINATTAPAGLRADEQVNRLAKPSKAAGVRVRRENVHLKEELAATREYLQSIIEEQEAASEELKSANEEAQASNEELETAKEELQSANEELNTVNEELRIRNAALTEVNSDLSNVLTSITVPLVMVGKDLKIRRFTRTIEPMLNLIESDVGRLISDLKPNIDVPDLLELLRSVVKGATPGEREIQGVDGRGYLLQVLPYKVDHKIDGALLVLHDIDAIKHSRDYAEAVVETVGQPLVILSKDLKIRRVNRAFYKTFRVTEAETKDRFIYDLGNRQWNIPKLREALEEILPDAGGFNDFMVEHEFESIGRKTMLLSGRVIRQPAPYDETILLAIEDITQRLEQQRLEGLRNEQTLASERRARELEAELAQVLRALTVGELATSIAHEVNQPLAGIVTNAEAGLRWLGSRTPNLPEVKESLALIVRDGNRAGEVIRRIRSFLKKDEHEMAIFDINEVVQEAIALAKTELQRCEVSMRVKLGTGLPAVRGDRVQLQQVVLHLMINSRDAMALALGRSHELLVSSEKCAGPDGRPGVLVTVRDSGMGVKQQDINRIFDAFFTTKSNGMGLGLTINRSIIEAHGGRIWAEANDGPGLSVRFSLPSESEGQA
ncbi:MAG: chemotaxis protein CheB [Acidobacteriia bacterium]|nr:chemotaxis protein CheB [Terriglobia bacterium]